MISSLNALGPIFLVVLVGFLLRRLAFPGESFWPAAERLTYYLLFPALLVNNLASAHFGEVALGDVVLMVVLLLVIMTLVLAALRPWVAPTAAAFTSVYQGGVRFNTYVGLAAAKSLYGDAGLVVAAIAIAIMIPLVNVLCVLIFALYSDRQGKISWLATFKQMGKNPLILGCLAGILLNITGIGLPFWSQPMLKILGQAALPLGLLAVGVALDLRALRGGMLPLAWSSLIKFVAMPLTAAGLGVLLGASTLVIQVMVLFAALPTASSAYILARQMGGDAPLMAGIITAQTLLAMLTLPVTLALLNYGLG
ncbi:AEC family transporter [Pokkaliibacter sp. CJK22405]|uniref:AEC family transporter n=1 Tax=Pokkaliibacter sp. CJK22405 TaxID=3384615 RepID=UPI003984E3FC